MDQSFLDDLDRELTDVGIDEVWKKPIGSRLIWFSPVSTTGQGQVQETMMNEALGSNLVYEAKKVTLSRSIIGVDKKDLRAYRNAGPVFTVHNSRDGAIKVDLPTYLLYKMSDWGHDWIDAAFDVFVDLMESYKKSLLKEIKFENLKDPRSELAEIEDRAAVIRDQLGLPRMMEIDLNKTTDPAPAPDAVTSEPEGDTEMPVAFKRAYSPFERVPEVPEAPPPVPPVNTIPVPIPTKSKSPVPRGYNPMDPANLPPRAAEVAALENSLDPFQAVAPGKVSPAMPSTAPDVIEQRASGRAPVAPPEVDPIIRSSINPRFAPQKR